MPRNFSFIVPGKLAGCARPGRLGDLRSDLSGLSRRGIGAIVSLTEAPLSRAALRAFDFRALHLPVEDFQPPDMEQIAAFVAFVDECLADGLAVAVHCGAGYGRTGTMLACYLVHAGMTPDGAIDEVRRLRPGSIETPEQAASVREFARSGNA